jgi:hypothetical protein
LSDEARNRLSPYLELVSLPLGDAVRHIYFPTDCVISLLYVMENGATAEISVVGNDGLVGVALYLGGEITPSRAVVQSAGSAYRSPRTRLTLDRHTFRSLTDHKKSSMRYFECIIYARYRVNLSALSLKWVTLAMRFTMP